jgi:hypothetical protein
MVTKIITFYEAELAMRGNLPNIAKKGSRFEGSGRNPRGDFVGFLILKCVDLA